MLSRYIIRKQDWGRHELSIERDGLTIGSAFENDLLLNHPTVSRTHAGICEVAGLFWLTNLSKSNGTLVNGKLTDLTYLDTGDTIQIGVFLIRTTVRQHELILEVERYFDSFTAGNRGAQLLTDPGLTIAEGPATILMENGAAIVAAALNAPAITPEAQEAPTLDLAPLAERSVRLRAVGKSLANSSEIKQVFQDLIQEIDLLFDSVVLPGVKDPNLDQWFGELIQEIDLIFEKLDSSDGRQRVVEISAASQNAEKVMIQVSDLQKLLARQRQQGAVLQVSYQGKIIPVQPTSRNSTLLLNKARLQRDLAGLLTSIIALPDEDRKDFQQAMTVFWERRKQAIENKQKLHDESVLRPQKPDPVLEEHNLYLGKWRFHWLPTSDLTMPWPRGYLFTVGAVTLLAVIVAIFAWEKMYSPGPVSSPHSLKAEELVDQSPLVMSRLRHKLVATGLVENKCAVCHPSGGSMQAQCIDCHQTSHFNPQVIAAHTQVGIGCTDCHTEHKGLKFEPGHVSRSMCVDCHRERPKHPKAVKADGHSLTAPHGGSIGYPIVDGTWVWTKPLNQHMVLPEYLSPREQFHLVHMAASVNQDWKCSGCHTSFATPAAIRAIDRNKCAVCHSQSLGVETSHQLDVLANQFHMDCASCHPQHGKDRQVIAALHPPGKEKPVISIGDAYRGGKAWEWTSLGARFGGMCLTDWTLFLSVIPLAATGFLVLDVFRRRQILQRLSGHVINFHEVPPKFADTRYADHWESAEQQELAKESAKQRPVPHPIINYETCIGCHACILACPQDVLGFDEQEHHAVVVNYEQCMEDTGCQQACPTVPQSCVLINTKLEIREPPRPLRKSAAEGFETFDVPGIYLVGDVSGVPLIRNAIREGRTAIDKIAEVLSQPPGVPDVEYDVAIIGIGPAGLAATARASEKGLRYLALEQGRRYATIAEKYPAGKYVAFNPFIPDDSQLGPIKLEGTGDLKERMISWWDESVAHLGLTIHEFEGCTGLEQNEGFFVVKTVKHPDGYRARKVILAIGNAGEPRKLGVPGETAERVRYRLKAASDFQNQKVMIVGAGNSAVEAAVDLAGKRQPDGTVVFPEEGGNEVTLVIRSDFPKDLTLENKMWVYYCIDKGRIKAFFGAAIREIRDDDVVLESVRGKKELATVPNDVVFAMVGSVPPKEFLSKVGIKYV